ncbi:MAG: succinate dehydrogenase cytochrome b subunit [Nitrospirae bacterium]|nr:succinate dehydrogenase cytochrome b subunit [Nitrospirota bacterium]
MILFQNRVGRKIVMSLTGLAMVIFVIIHLLGNASLFSGPDGINAYGKLLHSLGAFLWLIRLIMLTALCLHILFGIHLTLENRAAKPQRYAVRKDLSSTFAGRNMIWTGLLIASYLLYHLLHFTLEVIYPGLAAYQNPDAAGRPDIFMMVVLSFRNISVAGLYVLAMGALALHLSHGIQSMFQTLGLNNERTLPAVIKIGTIAAVVLFLGYISIPVSIVAGLVGR